MCNESGELYKLIKKVKLFSFEDGLNFKNKLLQDNPDFPKNGVYLMFEDGEECKEKKRIVRIGINRGGLLINRLNRHINGTKRTSIFRKHLWRILCNNDNEDPVTDYIKRNIKFCIISGPENKEKREELESKIISTVSNCKECCPSSNWLGLKSETRKIRESGLWNVHHIFSKNKLDGKDLKLILNSFYDK